MKHTLARTYCAFAVILLLIPLALADFRGIIASPSLSAFETRFGLRRQMITWHNNLLDITGHSGGNQVLMGRDRWLFFRETLGDYTGSSALTGDEIETIADKLAGMSASAEAVGSQLIVMIAPNKASVYPENMPFYIMKGNGGNREVLEDALNAKGVAVLPAYDILAGAKGDAVLYHRDDSHWNNLGAAMVSGALFDMAGVKHEAYTAGDAEMRNDWDGDLYHMLYPASAGTDTQYYFDMKGSFESRRPIHTGEEMLIETNGGGNKRLYMVRDSFANALVPFLAESFGEAVFTRSLTAFQMPEDAIIIIEIAERRIPLLLEAFE